MLTSMLHYHHFNTYKWILMQRIQTNRLYMKVMHLTCVLYFHNLTHKSHYKLLSDLSDIQEGSGYIRYTCLHLKSNITFLTGEIPALIYIHTSVSSKSLHVWNARPSPWHQAQSLHNILIFFIIIWWHMLAGLYNTQHYNFSRAESKHNDIALSISAYSRF